MNRHELEERLINFAVIAIKITDRMKKTKAANHLSGQLVCLGTSPALNYGEAQSGESRKDFIHKVKVAPKELNETFVCLKIIQKAKLCTSEALLLRALKEQIED